MRNVRIAAVALSIGVFVVMCGCGQREDAGESRLGQKGVQALSRQQVSSSKEQPASPKPESQNLLEAVKKGNSSDVDLPLAEESSRGQMETNNLPIFAYALLEDAQLHGWVIDSDDVTWTRDENREYEVVTENGKKVRRSGWLSNGGGVLFQSGQASMDDPPQLLLYKGKAIAQAQRKTNDDRTLQATERRQEARRGETNSSDGNKEFLRPPDFLPPRGKNVAVTGEPLPNELYSKLTALLEAATSIWPASAEGTEPSADTIDTMVVILSDDDIVGDGTYCDAGYHKQGGSGWAWGLSIYGAPPSKECKTLMRLYPNGAGLSPGDAADRFGTPCRKKTEREVQHLVYGNVDLIYEKDKYLGAILFFTR